MPQATVLMATFYDARTSLFVNLLACVENSGIYSSITQTTFEVTPFTIPTASADSGIVSKAIACYIFRWITTVWLFSSAIKAMFKRNILHINMLFRPDTYEDLKLDFFIVLFQMISLTFTAQSMLVSPVSVSNMMEPQISNKFLLLRG